MISAASAVADLKAQVQNSFLTNKTADASEAIAAHDAKENAERTNRYKRTMAVINFSLLGAKTAESMSSKLVQEAH